MAFCSHPAHPGTSVGGGPWRKEADPASSAPQAHPSDTIVSDLKKQEKSNERSVALTTYCATRAMSGWPRKLIGHGLMCMQPTRAMPPTSPGSPSSLPCMLLFFNIACPINVLSPSYYLNFENRLHHCVLHGEINKSRPHLHIFWRYFAKVASCYMLYNKLPQKQKISCTWVAIHIRYKLPHMYDKICHKKYL